MKSIQKIVLTGGPCAGKTAALTCLRAHFEQLGFRVLTVSETASDLINGGISPFNMNNVDFQYIVTSTMRFKEAMMYSAAISVPQDNILIMCDRAQMDNAAYMTDEEYNSLLLRMNTSRVEMRDGYDAVFHLETSAKSSNAEIYAAHRSDNKARYETAQEAVDIDDKLLRSWTGHPHLRVIPARSSFQEKIEHLIREVECVATQDMHYETERAFLIKRPLEETLLKLPFCRAVQIEQCYIEKDGMRFRIRRRGENGAFTYTLTKKRSVTDIRREEYEIRITQAQYDEYKKSASASLEKTRYCIVHEAKYFELDVYPFSNDHALLEIELTDESESFTLPDFAKYVREVSSEKKYRNSSLAKTHHIEV